MNEEQAASEPSEIQSEQKPEPSALTNSDLPPISDELASEHIQEPTVEYDEFVDSLVVYDEEEECPYLENQTARMPLRFPMSEISSVATDILLESGYRRSGKFLYRAECPTCQACEAIRLEVSEFHPNRSQKRALKKGNSVFELEIGPPVGDQARVDLFNKHRNVRGLNRHGTNVDIQEYKMFLVDSCLETFEITYLLEDKLAGVAICDRSENSVSAVYTFFDPDLATYSPGTYSIMKQIEFCQQQDIQYLYLGYFVAGSKHMNYKQRFKPHQRLQNGMWKTH